MRFDKIVMSRKTARKSQGSTFTSFGLPGAFYKKRRSRADAVQDQLSTADQLVDLNTLEILKAQSAENFTYRCVDCCHNPKVCLKAFITPCLMNGEIAIEIGSGSYEKHCNLFFLSPFFIGSYYSVGKNKVIYRSQHSIPGLNSDDYCLSCVCPCFVIAQLRNQLDCEKFERERLLNLIARALKKGEDIERK